MTWRKTISKTLTSSDFWTAASTIIIAVFTVELYCVSNRQWQTSQQAINLSQLTTIAEVGNPDATKIVDGQTTLTFKNTGQTKALNARVELFYFGADSAPPNLDPLTAFAKLGQIDIDHLQEAEDSDLRRFEKLHLPEPERNAVRKNWENIMRGAPRRVSLPPAYVREIPAKTDVPYPISLQQQSSVIFIFGFYRYDDELGGAHERNPLCWRFESNTVLPCLMFQPIER